MNDKKEDVGPAFASAAAYGLGGDFDTGQEGMSLRDYFAAAALQGIMANPELAKAFGAKECKEAKIYPHTMAYEAADAMVKERKK